MKALIVALGDVEMEADVPLILRYRVVTFDGDVPVDVLNELSEDWSQ